MSFGEIEERPAKKRRFFVEDSPIADRSVKQESPTIDGNNAPTNIPQDLSTETQQEPGSTGVSDGFDVELLNGIAGEELPSSIVDKLKKLSGNNIERGRLITSPRDGQG
jgi:DNA repair protein RAD5